MNKERRNEITKMKHKRRCNVFGIKPELHYSYKAQAVPCSCAVCVGGKHKRNIKHRNDGRFID